MRAEEESTISRGVTRVALGAAEGRKRQSLYRALGKRFFDIVASAVGLLLAAPILLISAVALKLSSPGPVFFAQTRVGKGERLFRMFKLRSMVAGGERFGPVITIEDDPRITRIGALLRKLKLDELPQLWNVMKGDMSFVGPRPEMPEFLPFYTEEERRSLLAVRPGITGTSSLVYRNEQELLARVPDPQRFYIETILPHKNRLNQDYIDNMSFRHDVYLIFSTGRSIFRVGEGTPP